MSIGTTGPTNKLAVHQMDYMRLLREPEAAFGRGEVHEGQRLLDMAAAYERKLTGVVDDSPRDPSRRT